MTAPSSLPARRRRAGKAAADLERAVAAAERGLYVLRLYVAGMAPLSTRTIVELRRICEERLRGRYDLEVIDILQQPELAKEAQIFAVPTLIKTFPLPIRRLIGDLTQPERVLVGLDLAPSSEA